MSEIFLLRARQSIWGSPKFIMIRVLISGLPFYIGPYVNLFQLGNSTLGRVPLLGPRFLKGGSVSTDPLSMQMDFLDTPGKAPKTDLKHLSLKPAEFL